jgi:AAA+ ATPase superfamily predicted ATPase
LGVLGQSLRTRAYRDLYILSLILIVLLSTGLAWGAAAVQGTAIDWKGVILGLVGGLAFGLLFIIVGSMAYGAAFGTLFGTTFGVVFGTTFGLIFGVVYGLGYGLMGGPTFGLAGSLAFGVAFGIAFVMAFGAVFGVAAGATFIVALVVALAIAFAVMLVVVGGPAVLLALLVAVAVTIAAGASRLLAYPFQWWQARSLSRSRGDPISLLSRHPVLWDEYNIWAMRGTNLLLRACFEADLEQGFQLAARIAANPFQRWAVQRTLSDFLNEQPAPLSTIYGVAHSPILKEYLNIPTRRVQFRNFPSARLVLLGEIGQQCVAASSEATESTESLIWRVTRRRRRMEPTPLSQFSTMLYELFRDENKLGTAELRQIKLAEQYGSAYEGIRPFQYGIEVADSFATIDPFLGISTVEALASAWEHLGWMDGLAEPLLRPTIIEALQALGDVSREVSVFVQATNLGQKSAALNRAAGGLNELAGYLQAEVPAPERVLLVGVIELWSSIIAAEQGHLGEAALLEMAPAARRAAGIQERRSTAWQRPAMPFDNPYVVGDPVYPPLLVGRKDVFDRIGEVWSAKKNPDSIILYGHRRMGKSTILRNLDRVAPEGSVVVYADMAGETSFIESTADLLLGLADKIHASVRRAYPDTALPEPDPEAYATQARAQFHLNRLLEGVRDLLDDHSLILALDEFEAVEKAVEAGKVGREIYQFLRTKTQEPRLALVFGGLHTLDEMSRDYQQPFYGSYENIRVSYLARKDAWRLIANPTDEFVLNYEPEAVERVITETGGQPYLVQQICRDALDHLNHELFDLGLVREVCISVADVEAVLDQDFFRRGTVYFDGVWTQASNDEQRALLRAMAQCNEPCALEGLQAIAGLEADTLQEQLRWAERHDILYEMGSDGWGFCVPLMRRWIYRTR